MSHTHRRKRTHNRHQRGRWQLPETRRRQAPVRAARPQRTHDQLRAMVTDHAIVRWMERVVGIDVRGKFIEDLLTQERAELAGTMKTGKVRVCDTSVVLVIRGGVVASVLVEGVDG